ncbi:hypothetical protein HPB50_017324 [Hyalomma asiaticum]|uniref:Uncharacterized protein n=1 Tax=Hyalomma asiaticum TaxID=266040 RepID=A0ACB7RX17_HYAAI|nr:hypothetical protein HPB50_017324 [Hyalomma asiaticum]
MDHKSVVYVDAASGKSGAVVASVVDGQAARVLSGRRLNRKISRIWSPAHTSVPGNEAAHELARALYFRNMDEPLQSYTEITENYRLLRRVVPPPDKSLNNRETVAWRRLQAGNFVNPVWTYHVQKDDRPNDSCKHCGARGTLDHILWEYDSSPGAKSNINCREAWEALLRSKDPASQQQAIRLVVEAARSQDFFACF